MYEVLFALTLIFGVAAVLLLVAARASLPVVPFYLLAGILIGVAIDEGQVLDLAQWGIAFLVFLFGVRVDLEAFRSTGPISVAVSLVQIAVVGGLAYGAGVAFGLDALNAVYLAVAAALSSSLVAVSYLDDTGGLQPTFERVAETIHFTEDVLGILVVVALSAFVYATAPGWEPFLAAAWMFVLAVVVRYLFFHRITARLRGDDEVMMLVGISFVVGFIALAEYVGLSVVVGAFAAGVAVADDYPHSLELVDTVDDLEDFFSPIFFVTVGALLTLPGLDSLAYAALLVAAVVLLNPLVVAYVLLRGGFDGRTAVLAGLTLDQVSAISLFVAIEARAAGTIADPVFDAIVLAAVTTMFVATYTARHGEEINRRLRQRGVLTALGEPLNERTSVSDDLSDHVVVVDFQHGSRQVLDVCETLDREAVVVEDDPTTFDTVRAECDNYVFGDVLDDRVWERANVEEAALVVSLTPEHDRAVGVVELDADVPRLVRVDDEDTAREFLQRDVSGVIYPYAVSGAVLAEDLEALLSGDVSRGEFTDRGHTGVRTD